MLAYPEIDPVIFSVGSLSVRWYGFSYLIGFLGCYLLSVARGRGTQWTPQKLADILFYIALGIIFGGRIGYVLLYTPAQVFSDPLSLFAFWLPGRSFHGGMLGVFLAMWIYVKFDWRKFVQLMDFIAPCVPIGLGFGRLGNFINGELYGRVTTVPWGMVFPDGGPLPRHPSQLYEFFLEGVVLCIVLVWYARKPRKIGAVSGLFLLGYGLSRFVIEFFRQPDSDQGFILWNWLTMGQMLSIPMIIFGLYFLLRKAEY